jgi:hypothetical protein
MKARVKKTGEIVEAELKGFDNLNIEHYIINGNQNWILSEFSLEFLESDPNPDYWTRLEHQYAGMAMQGILSNPELFKATAKNAEEFGLIVPTAVVIDANCFAHALIQELKEKEERK